MRLLSIPLRHPRWSLVLTLSITVLFALLLARDLRIDNGIGVWLPPDDPALDRYDEFRGIFGEDNFVIIAFEPVDLTREEVREQLQRLQLSFAQLGEVDRVIGPFSPEAEGASWAADRLVSDDRRAVAFLALPAEENRAGLVPALERCAASSGIETPPSIAGPEAINYYLDVGSQDSFGTLFPVVVALIGGVLLAALRRPRIVLGILLVGGLATVWSLGCLVLAGRTMNMVVSVLPALLIVLGTAYSLHLCEALLAQRDDSPRRRWSAAIADTVKPCGLTALTTAAGLASLAFADIPPVRDLGVFAALGVLFSFLLVFAFLPPFLLLVGGAGPSPIEESKASGALTALPRRIRRARYPVLIATLLCAGVAAGGIGKLRIGSDILRFFPDDHPIVLATHSIEERFFGLTPIEIRWHGDRGDLLSAAGVSGLREMEAACRAEPEITDVITPLDFDERLDTLSPEMAAGVLAIALSGGLPDPRMGSYLHPDGEQLDVRLTCAVRTIPIEPSVALVERLEARLEESTPDGIEGHVTGAIPILVRMQALLLTTQLGTFAASMSVVTGLLLLAFRSVRLTLLSLVPNLLPILLVLGFMGLAGIPLDVSTVTVASIALGMVVDDTIHFLYRYRGSPAGPAVERLESVFRTTGRPILFTSLAVAIGFAAFSVAPFRPTHYFGGLIAATALLALIADLIVLPALLLVGRERSCRTR
jgi:uncharacterized protein